MYYHDNAPREINSYYTTGHGVYSVAREQFYDYLKREGTTVQDYWTGEKYRCFFRRNKDTNQTNDNVSFYYPIDEGIQPGSIIKHQDKVYLVLNQESIENRAYHRSDAINADVMLNTYDPTTGEEINIPCFAYDLTSATPTQADSHMFLEIAGNVEMMTGDNEMSRKLGIDYEFSAMGNWYHIVSINHKTGITRIISSVILSPSHQPEYSVSINADDNYTEGEEVQLSAVAYRGEQVVTNPTFEWTSSDESVATVTQDGFVSFLSAGYCTITCRWNEHDVTDTAYIQVASIPVELTCTITGGDTMKENGTATYTATFYQADGVTVDNTIVPVWTLDLPSNLTGLVTINSQSGNTVTLKASKNTRGNSFSLRLQDANELYSAIKGISITSWI